MTRTSTVQVFRLRPGIVALALCLAAGGAACRQSMGADLHVLAEAVGALEAGAAADALEATNALSQGDPDTALALAIRGTAELLMYDVGSAQESFEVARSLQPSDPLAYLGFAACAAAASNWRTAAVAYERALARECAEPALARTCLAFAALAAGDIDGALEQVGQARQEGRCGPLADQVVAMAHLALGDAASADVALHRSAAQTRPVTEAVLSPLYVSPPGEAPPLVLAREPEPAEYASSFGADGIPVDSPAADTDGQLSIAFPAEGAAVADTVYVQLGGAADETLGCVVLLVDGKFRAIRNVAPFRTTLDTRTCSDGAHSLEVRGYDRLGRLVGTDTVTVFVNNGTRRTLDPAAAAVHHEVARRLERCLALRPHPLNQPYLMGRILDSQGRLGDAVAAFEYVFSIQPMFPSVRTRLIDAYGRLGILAQSDQARIIRQLPPGSRQVALTFDDGPGPAVTPWVLDRLDEAGAKATFFVVGKQVELYPHLVAEIRRRGHELACHAYSHADLSELSIIEIERELVKTRALVREATGDFLTYFRPPGGNYDQDVQRAVGEMGYATVFWTVAVTDYPNQASSRVFQLMRDKIEDGGIVLLHNGFDATVDVLPELLSFLKSKQYRCVTLSEGLGATAPSVRLAHGE